MVWLVCLMVLPVAPAWGGWREALREAREAVDDAKALAGEANALAGRLKGVVGETGMGVGDAAGQRWRRVVRVAILEGRGRLDAWRQPYGSATEFTAIGEAYEGPVVWYVNGLGTNKERAEHTAGLLAEHLGRPVRLIHNPTRGLGRDLAESAMDRSYPWLPGRVRNALLSDTTRTLNAVLRDHAELHPGEPLSIVSHSQGCLMVRDALVFASEHGRGGVLADVRWVAMGVPMVEAELRPRPAQLRVLTNRGDLVSHLIGGRLFREGGQGRGHAVDREYIHRIDPQWLR